MLQIAEGIRLEPDKFCFWLQGFCELHGEPPTAEQWKHIKEHLEMVFVKAVPVQKAGPAIAGWPGGIPMPTQSVSSIPRLFDGGSVSIC